MYVYGILRPLCLGLRLVLGIYKEQYLVVLKCVSYWLHCFYGKWESNRRVIEFLVASLSCLLTFYFMMVFRLMS